MTYYLLMPCRTTAAFISTLKKARRVNLRTAADRLAKAGYAVEDVEGEEARMDVAALVARMLATTLAIDTAAKPVEVVR